MSIRDQERRQRQAERRINEAMRRADREVRQVMESRARAADRRKEEVKWRIERGDTQPRPLPGLREDSMASTQSMASMQSMESIESMQSAGYASALTEEEARGGANLMEDMPLEGVMPYDPGSAGEDLAQRVTEETGAAGDPHAHNERKAGELAQQMTEDTGAGGDMNLQAERKVQQMGSEMFED